MSEHFTQGYAFSDNLQEMVTIRKLRPPPIAGLLCGPGGFLNDDENIFDGQAREFEEETGVESDPEEWLYMGDIIGANGKPISIFCAFGDKFMAAKTKTDEQVYTGNVVEFLQRKDLVREFADLVQKSLDPAYPKTHYTTFTARYRMAA